MEAIRALREERERWSLKVKELTDERNKYHRLYQGLLTGRYLHGFKCKVAECGLNSCSSVQGSPENCWEYGNKLPGSTMRSTFLTA
jgi:hypothetical protein